jgi:hypothetical protein
LLEQVEQLVQGFIVHGTVLPVAVGAGIVKQLFQCGGGKRGGHGLLLTFVLG